MAKISPDFSEQVESLLRSTMPDIDLHRRAVNTAWQIDLEWTTNACNGIVSEQEWDMQKRKTAVAKEIDPNYESNKILHSTLLDACIDVVSETKKGRVRRHFQNPLDPTIN